MRGLLDMVLSRCLSYVGMVIVGRAEQDWKALLDILTREVGRNTLTSLELAINQNDE